MQLKFEGDTFTVRRDSAGSIVLECADPKPHRKPGPHERVPCPRAQAFEFDGQKYLIWRDPHNGVQFSRDHWAKPAKPAPLARDAKPKSVPINIVSVKTDPHALPQRTGVARAVPISDANKTEIVKLGGTWYYASVVGGKVALHRCLAKR